MFTDPCSYIAVAGRQTDGSGFYEVCKIAKLYENRDFPIPVLLDLPAIDRRNCFEGIERLFDNPL